MKNAAGTDCNDVHRPPFSYEFIQHGSRETHEMRGQELPLGSRLVAIVDAFDAMTSDQVYRRALSRERDPNPGVDGTDASRYLPPAPEVSPGRFFVTVFRPGGLGG